MHTCLLYPSLSLPPSLSLSLSLTRASVCVVDSNQQMVRDKVEPWLVFPPLIEYTSVLWLRFCWVQLTDGGETRLALGDITSVMGKQYDIISCLSCHHGNCIWQFWESGHFHFLPHSLPIQSSIPHSCSRSCLGVQLVFMLSCES